MSLLIVQWPLGSVVTLLSTNQITPGSIYDCQLGIFYNAELFHGIYEMGVSVYFVHFLSCVVIGGGPCTGMMIIHLCGQVDVKISAG